MDISRILSFFENCTCINRNVINFRYSLKINPNMETGHFYALTSGHIYACSYTVNVARKIFWSVLFQTFLAFSGYLFRSFNTSVTAAEVSETYLPIDSSNISPNRPPTSSHVNYSTPEELVLKRQEGKKKSKILTDTPVKEIVRKEQLEGKKKKIMAQQNKKKKLSKNSLY